MTDAPMPRVGVAGLGNMGGGIARVLARAGMLGAVWDVRAEAVAALDLPGLERGIAALAACDVVLMPVPGSAEVAALLEAGLLAPGGRVLVDLTTAHPDASRPLAARARVAGVGYLDAGMTGGAAGAASGRLTLMLGGDAADLDRARPALDAIAARVFHVGPTGAGHTMKLVHNMICHTVFLATVEGCRAAEKAGVPLDRAVEVLNAGNARSFITERRFPDHIVSGSFDGRSHVGNLAKDLAMASDLFRQMDTPGAYAELTAALLASAMAQGLGGVDFTRLYEAYDVLQANRGQ